MDHPAIQLRSLLREKEFWMLFLLVLIPFYQVLFLGQTFFYRDLHSSVLPYRQLLVEIVRNGEFPLWDPYLDGGRPFFANPSFSVLYPSVLLYFIFHPVMALNLDITLHVLFASLSAYALARELSFGRAPALICGAVFAFSGFAMSLVNIFVRLLALPYLPLLILFWHRFLNSSKKKWLLVSALCATIQFFAGAVELSAVTLATLLLWSLFGPYHLSFRTRFLSWMVLCVLIAMLGAVQLFPAAELTEHTQRGEGLAYSHSTIWSLHPKRLPELIFSSFTGRHDSLAWASYWGRNIEDEGSPYISSIYLGCLSLPLALLGGGLRTNNRIPSKLRRLWLTLLVLGIFLSLGRFAPGFYYLYKYIPFLDIFRFPVKFMIFSMLPLALLTAYVFQTHFEDQKPLSAKALAVFWAVGSSLLLFTIFFYLSEWFSSWFQRFFFELAPDPSVKSKLSESFVQTAGMWIAMCLLLQHTRMKHAPWQPKLLMILIIGDLVIGSRGVNPTAPKELFTLEPAVVALVRSEIGEGRLYRAPTREKVELRTPSDDLFWGVRWDFEVLNYFLASFYKIPVVFSGHIHGMQQLTLSKLSSVLESLPWNRKSPILSAGAVNLVLTSENLSEGLGFKKIATVKNNSNLLFHLYRNQRAMKPVNLVTQVVTIGSDQEALKALSQPDFDPRKQILLNGPLALKNKGDAKFTANQISKNANSSVYVIKTDRDGYLVFSDVFYPGWRVYVDDEEEPVLRANHNFSAILLSSGTHTVKRIYRPNSFLLGAGVSLVSSVLVFMLLQKSAGRASTNPGK